MKGTKQSDKLKTKRGMGRSKFAATKKLKVVTKKQAKNVKRGRIGQSPKTRKVMSNDER